MELNKILEKGYLKFPEDRAIVFKNKQDVCSLFGKNAVKKGFLESAFYHINDNESIWFVKEHTEFENGFINDFYPDYIKEIRENNQKDFVLSVLKYPNEKRYVFFKTSNGYEFFGVYSLDVNRSKDSLESDVPTRYWNRVSNEVRFN